MTWKIFIYERNCTNKWKKLQVIHKKKPFSYNFQYIIRISYIRILHEFDITYIKLCHNICYVYSLWRICTNTCAQFGVKFSFPELFSDRVRKERWKKKMFIFTSCSCLNASFLYLRIVIAASNIPYMALPNLMVSCGISVFVCEIKFRRW